MSEGLIALGFVFGVLSVLYLTLIAGTVTLIKEMNLRLIVLGLLTASAAIGYGSVMMAFVEDAGGPGIPTSTVAIDSTTPLAGTLMKVAVVLILTGVGRLLITKPSVSETDDSNTTGGENNA